jgi:hypothetical protein
MIEQETHVCPKCEEPLPVTGDFWYRFGHGKALNLSICKSCHKAYYKERNAKATALREKRMRPKSEFDGFCKAALKEQIERANRPIPSIYKEI